MSEEKALSGVEPVNDEDWEQHNPEIKRKIGIDEYQPKGTLTLTLLYFVIVVLFWIFMFFFEFAGNDPTIID